jgi:chromosome segregation ATPase
MKRMLGVAVVLAVWFSAGSAQAQSLEEQLRTQLRETRGQLQDLQSEQAAWNAQKQGIQNERDQAHKELAQAQAELSKLRASAAGSGPELAAERSARQRAEAALQQAQRSGTDAAAKLQTQQARESTLTIELADAKNELNTCGSRNQQLYKVGQEILDAYAHMDMGTVLSARQPFAAAARVKLENAAQGYGDRLYEQRYVPGAVKGKQP